jgi:hypothetical protein
LRVAFGRLKTQAILTIEPMPAIIRLVHGNICPPMLLTKQSLQQDLHVRLSSPLPPGHLPLLGCRSRIVTQARRNTREEDLVTFDDEDSWDNQVSCKSPLPVVF